ncbi:MBL fold metallo-hydrolase [Gorillibacterium sp. CAU 1737]|uniref:MBL fold metallo-hydrolase n=1 Tax=Gorillibacterium sp. CAU 1737 TaxID=3140362 RepID=UPI0032607651
MKITMAGTGSALGYAYFTNSCVVEVDGYNLLIDCGETTPHGLHALGYDLAKLDGILITHIHGDHVNGLEKLAWTFRYALGKKVDLIAESGILARLWEHTLKGGLEEAEEGILELSDLFHVMPIDNPELRPIDLTPKLRVELISVQHITNKKSYSLLINERLYFSGDSRFDPDLLNDLVERRGVEVILHDCQLHDLAPVHASLNQLLTLPEVMQERIWLMHYGDNMPEFLGKSGNMQFLIQGRSYFLSDNGNFACI